MRNQSFYHNNRFYNGQVDMLLALTHIGPGDGGTMVIPARSAALAHTIQRHALWAPEPTPNPNAFPLALGTEGWFM